MTNNYISRRKFLGRSIYAGGAFSLAAFFGGCGEQFIGGEGAKKRPNVLFIAVDDLRPEIACYGRKHMKTPNIDRLAKQGVVFGRNYCQVPTCGASRASLLSGMRPKRGRFLNFKTYLQEDIPDAVTLPEHFKNNGYYTVSNGKVFHHQDDCPESWSEPDWRSDKRMYLLEESIERKNKNENNRGPAYECADVEDFEYSDGKMIEKSIKDLRRLSIREEPFFLAAGIYKPHLPFNSPKKYWDMYDRERIEPADNPFVPKGAPKISFTNWGELRQYDGMPKEGPLDEEMTLTILHAYYAAVSYADALVGMLLDELENLGIADDTIVVLWGDHGWNLGEHSFWSKHVNYETSLHAPLLIKAPGFAGGTKVESLSEFIDIYPTLCDLAGIERPSQLQGESLVEVMKNPKAAGKKAVFSRIRNGDSVKTDRYRYTEWVNEKNKRLGHMLYDHQKNPDENVNVVDLPEYKNVVAEHNKMLEEVRKVP
jgi:arylsulfatase A-like enzyme